MILFKSVKNMSKNTSSYIALIGMSIVNFLGCLDLTIVNTALPAIQNSFQVSETQLQWVMNILLLALTAFMVMTGKLADRYGRRQILYIGMLLFAATSLGAALSSTFGLLILFRFFQGIAIAILYTAPIALIPALFPNNAAKAMGIIIGVSGFGLAIGPVLGGVLTGFFGWHAIFFINLPLTLIAFLFCWKHLPESKSANQESMDFLGALFLIIAIFSFIFTTVKIHEFGLSLKTYILYLISIISGITFVIRELKTVLPIIDFHLFSNQRFLIGLSANFFLAFFYAIDFFFIPLHLHNIAHYSSDKIGLVLLPATMMVAILSPISEALCKRFGTKLILCTGYLLLIMSAILQILFSQDLAIGWQLISYILFGFGWGLILSPSLVTAISSLPESMGGVAMGSLGTLHNLGGAIGLALAAPLLYKHAMTLICFTSTLSFLIIFFGLKLNPTVKA